MANVIKYAEEYAEWVALGIGALFVLFVVYGNVVTPPIQASIPGGKLVTPGNVDQTTLDGPAQNLQRAMSTTDVPPMLVEPFAERFKQVIAGQDQTEVALAKPELFPNLGTKDHGPLPGPGGPVAIQPEVDRLPIPPTPVFVGVVSGLSNVSVPPAGGAQGGSTVVPTGVPEDKQWVTTFYKISGKELADAFAKANIPGQSNKTSFLQVELIREEKMADDSWGNSTVIEPLEIQHVPQFPGNDRQAQLQFKDWAEKNASNIIEPGFYQVLGGEKWRMYTEQAEVPAIAVIQKEDVKPATTKPTKTVKPPVKPKAEPKKEAPPAPHHTPTPTVPKHGGYAPKDPDRPNAPPNPRNPMPAGAPGMMPTPGVGAMPPGVTPRPAAQTNAAKVPGSAITGTFDPSTTGDILVWAHDDSVEADKTYRYRISYRLRNPVFQTLNIAKPELAGQFYLQSKQSEWSERPVTIKPRTLFWVARGVSPSGKSVSFEVFKWSQGKQTSKIFDVGPGDVIGLDPSGLYTTGWTVVDFRRDYTLDDDVVVITDENDNLLKRSFKRDQKDPQYTDLKAKVSSAKPDSGQAVAGKG